MPKYIPFLKFKQNEIQGLGMLDVEIKDRIRPFFDIPRTSVNQIQSEIHERLNLGLQNFEKLVVAKGIFEFYVDNFDLNDEIDLHGVVQYKYILALFSKYHAIPVLALDRHVDHNAKAFEYIKTVGGKAAVRLQLEDLESYSLTKKKLEPLWASLSAVCAQEVHLIIDARVITDFNFIAKLIAAFLTKFRSDFHADKIITTGSIIPANISELINTDSILSVPRQEYLTWKTLIKSHDGITFGDYGVVSPDYSDAEIDQRLLRIVSTPKVFYPYNDQMYVVRGNSFQNHPAGNGQFLTIAEQIEKQVFFRDKAYSYGEKYIFERSPKSMKKPDKAGSQGSWTKATLASHITFIANSI